MANLVVGRIRKVDEVERTIVLGHIKFSLTEGLPLSGLAVGTRVTATYEARDGRYWITECRVDEGFPAGRVAEESAHPPELPMRRHEEAVAMTEDRKTKIGYLASAVVLGLVIAGTAAWASPATDQVKVSVDQVLKIVQDTELRKPVNAEKRRSQIREVARGIFDFEEMAKRSLARHWAARGPEQRKRFTELFTDLLENSYVSKIETYGGEKIVYLPEQADTDAITVRSKLVTQRGTEIPIDYRMQKAGDRFRVYDVTIEGVSLVSNYRTQFNKIITQSSYDELVKKMEQKQLEVADGEKTRGSTPKKTP